MSPSSTAAAPDLRTTPPYLAFRQLSMRPSTVLAEWATSRVSSRSKIRPICDLSSMAHTRLGMPAAKSQPQYTGKTLPSSAMKGTGGALSTRTGRQRVKTGAAPQPCTLQRIHWSQEQFLGLIDADDEGLVLPHTL
eukprot:1133646-Pelagomonas_calceolata.AAC.8